MMIRGRKGRRDILQPVRDEWKRAAGNGPPPYPNLVTFTTAKVRTQYSPVM